MTRSNHRNSKFINFFNFNLNLNGITSSCVAQRGVFSSKNKPVKADKRTDVTLESETRYGEPIEFYTQISSSAARSISHARL